jgi:cellulase/cellobiase CelA1
VATYTATGKPDKLAATIVVTNTGGTTIHAWTVHFSWTGGEQKVKTFSGALVFQNGKAVTATALLLNATLAPGASTTFTFAGDGKSPVPLPTLTCTAL